MKWWPFKREKRSGYVGPESTLENPTDWLYNMLAGPTTSSGMSVTETNSIEVSAVYACVRVIAETLASLPLNVYERVDDRTRVRVPDHYLYDTLHTMPNSEQTSYMWREASQGNILLWGNAYAQIIRDQRGRVAELYPIAPYRVQALRDTPDSELYYRVDGFGRIPVSDLIHFRNYGDGFVGLSTVRLMREAIGLAMASEQYGSEFFGNGSRPGGVLQHPGVLREDEAKRLRSSWEASQGQGNSHRTAILEEGITWQAMGMPNDDAQFLETRRFTVEEIARAFRVPLHMIGHLDRSTFSNIEQQSIDFVQHTMRPWVVRWEQELNVKLLPREARRRYYIEFELDGLLRGDTETRFAAYVAAINAGIMSRNEARQRENLPPYPDGDEYLVPMNMRPTSEPFSTNEPPPADTTDDAESRWMAQNGHA